MTEQTCTLERKPCEWCAGTSSLNVGAGYFRDFDCDLSYGIGVCGGCGGLGFTVDDPGFRGSTKRIMDLRFAYCPTSEEEHGPGGPFPPSVLHERLLALKTAVAEHYEKYGPQTDEDRAKDKSFAHTIVEGCLAPVLERWRDEMTSDAAKFREMAKFDPEKASVIEAIALSAEGKFSEAESLLQRLVAERPDDSSIHHDLGVFYTVYRRDLEKALPHLVKSTELLPAKVVHFVQTAKVLVFLKRESEAAAIAVRSKRCPDFASLPDELKNLIEQIALAN